MTIETAPKSNIVIYERRRINQEEKRKIRGKQQDKKSTQTEKTLPIHRSMSWQRYLFFTYPHMYIFRHQKLPWGRRRGARSGLENEEETVGEVESEVQWQQQSKTTTTTNSGDTVGSKDACFSYLRLCVRVYSMQQRQPKQQSKYSEPRDSKNM